MNNYTQLNLDSQKPAESANKQSAQKKGSSHRAVMFGSLMLITTLSGGVLLISNGCSKARHDTAQIQPAPISAPSSASVPAVAVPVSKQETSTPKVAKRKRPSVITFHDATYGVSFQYPRKYSLKSGPKADTDIIDNAASMSFAQPGGIQIVSLQLSKEAYAGTDLGSAFFNVNVHPNLSSSECEQFASSEPGKPPVVPPAKVLVGKTEFDQFKKVDTADNSEVRYYHLFDNGLCYEFAEGLGVTSMTSDNDVTPVDRQAVFGKLDKILSTVKIAAVDQGEVAGSLVGGSGKHQ
jgi:hypothetical protein